MKTKMKKWNRIISFALIAMLLVNASVLKVNAEGTGATRQDEIEIMSVDVREWVGNASGNSGTRTALTDCAIAVAYRTNGMLIEIRTGATQVSPVVGVRDIEVEQKVWYGWKTVAVADGAEVYDNTGIICSMTFTGAEVGETYRVSCVHYADLSYDGVTQYVENANSTGSFVYND